MLLIPLFILIFAGASLVMGPDLASQQELKQAGAAVVAVVEDPVRKTEVKKTVDGILKESKQFSSVFEDVIKQINKQYKDHSAGPEEAFVVLRDHKTEWESSQMKMVDFQFELRAQMTEEEWNTVYNASE